MRISVNTRQITVCVVGGLVGKVAGGRSGEGEAGEADKDERQPGVAPGTPLDKGKGGQGVATEG